MKSIISKRKKAKENVLLAFWHQLIDDFRHKCFMIYHRAGTVEKKKNKKKTNADNERRS